MKQWKNLAEKDYLASIKPLAEKPQREPVEKITLYTDDEIGGLKAKIVDELPETGESGILYLILNTESEEGNVYDEYIWVEKDGTYVFEHIGTTDKVEIILYETTGQNTDGAMTQKAVTDALNSLPTSSITELTEAKRLWTLDPGIYYWSDSLSNSMTWFNSGGPNQGNARMRLQYNVCMVVPKGQNNNTRIIAFGKSPNSQDTVLGGNSAIATMLVDSNGTCTAFQTVLTNGYISNSLTTTDAGHPLDATQGKALNDKIGGDLSNLTTTDKTSLINAINELVAEIGNVESALHAINNGEES